MNNYLRLLQDRLPQHVITADLIAKLNELCPLIGSVQDRITRLTCSN